MRSLIDRGLTAPMLAAGDGALGFWAALRSCKGFEKTEEQRCWVHKIANVLDKLPKRLQADAKDLLHEMMKAGTEADAEKVKESFKKLYSDKYPKAVECLTKSWTELTTFFHYPAKHWQHIRTTNPIESSFATVKLRTRVTKGAGSKETAAVMAFKLLHECQKKWRNLRGHEELENLLKGLEYKDGVMVTPEVKHHETAASLTLVHNILKYIFSGYFNVKTPFLDGDEITTDNGNLGKFSIDSLHSDPNYRPQKYKNWIRFKNVDASEADGLEHGMWGYLVLDLTKGNEFQGKYIFQAGYHIGGTLTLACRVQDPQ